MGKAKKEKAWTWEHHYGEPVHETCEFCGKAFEYVYLGKVRTRCETCFHRKKPPKETRTPSTRLSDLARAAREAGMSYGYYVALRHMGTKKDA